MELKRFLVFKFESFYPSGGWNDFSASFEEFEEAFKSVDEDLKLNGHVVDREDKLFFVKIWGGDCAWSGIGGSLKEATQLAKADPVFQDREGKWHFVDEVQCDTYGPFNTNNEAKRACIEYAKTL